MSRWIDMESHFDGYIEEIQEYIDHLRALTRWRSPKTEGHGRGQQARHGPRSWRLGEDDHRGTGPRALHGQ